MSLAIEERAERLRELLQKAEVLEAMRERCEEQGHDYENCCSPFLQVYMRCKWCKEVR
jgi:sulfur transfer protein SufE